MYNLLAVLDGNASNLTDGGIVAIIAILYVFAILSLIIAITYLFNLFMNKSKIKGVPVAEKVEEKAICIPTPLTNKISVDINKDLDGAIATIVASIDYRNTIKDDVRVLSVNQIVQPTAVDVDPNDQDAIVASIVASMDYRNEIKQDIKIKKIKEIKNL